MDCLLKQIPYVQPEMERNFFLLHDNADRGSPYHNVGATVSCPKMSHSTPQMSPPPLFSIP